MSLIDLVRNIQDAHFCEQDGFPLFQLAGDTYCSVEYADGLLGGQKVIGVAEDPQGITLLFANGNRIPLTKPASGEPLVPKAGMLPHLRSLLIDRKLQGFRHGEWVGDQIPPERRPIFALEFSGDEPRDERTLEVSLESVKRITKQQK